MTTVTTIERPRTDAARTRPDAGHEFVPGEAYSSGSFAEPWVRCAVCGAAEEFHSEAARAEDHAHRFVMETPEQAILRQPDVPYSERTVVGVCRCGATTAGRAFSGTGLSPDKDDPRSIAA